MTKEIFHAKKAARQDNFHNIPPTQLTMKYKIMEFSSHLPAIQEHKEIIRYRMTFLETHIEISFFSTDVSKHHTLIICLRT